MENEGETQSTPYETAFSEFKYCSGERQEMLIKFVEVANAFGGADLTELNQNYVNKRINKTFSIASQHEIRYDEWSDHRDIVMNFLDRCFQTDVLNITTTTSILNSLCKMKCKIIDLPISIYAKFWRLLDAHFTSNERIPSYIALTLNGFANLGQLWHNLPIDSNSVLSQACLFEAVRRNHLFFDPKDTALTWHAFAKMGLLWNDLPIDIGEGILEAVRQNHENFSAESCAMVFYALGKLGRQWRDIAVDIQDGLLEYLRQNFQVGNNVTKIGSLAIWYSLTKIDLPLENIDQGTVDCLRESLLGPEVLSEDDLGNL